MRVADTWFGVAPAGGADLRLRETHLDPGLAGNMWLLRGRDRSVLIDTGTGMVPLRATVEALAGGPVEAVALNRFYDHAGGLHEFDSRAVHRAGNDAVTRPTGETSVASSFVCDAMFEQLPSPGYAAADYAVRGAAPTRLLDDGDRIELGDRTLEVLHGPGVSEESIALWDAEARTLYASDLLYEAPDGRTPRPRDPTAYVTSLARIATLPIARIRPGHFAEIEGADVAALLARAREAAKADS